MSNDTTSSRVWVLDAIGIVTEKPIWVKKILMIPNTSGDVANFVYWNPNKSGDLVSAGGKSMTVGTITGTSTLTSSGNIPSSVAVGYVFEILNTSGAAANVGKHLVSTAGDGNAVVVSPADWTNEASITYSWQTIKTYQGPYIKAGASDPSPVVLNFDCKPMRFNNLVLKTLSTSAKIYLFLDEY